MLTKGLLRLRDLRERNIVKSWPALKRKVERENFPPGRYLGPNSRVWTEEEVADWLNSRPTSAPLPRGIAAMNQAKAAKKRAAQAQTEAVTGTKIQI